MMARALVGRNIRRLRVAKGLSQEALGLAAGCEPSYVGRVERGRENPTVDLLEAIAKALGDPLAAFFDVAGARGPLKPGLPAGRKPRAEPPARRKPAVTA